MRDLARLLVRRVDPAELDQHADHPAPRLEVLVAIEETVGGLETHDPAQPDVLTELRGHLGQRLGDSRAPEREVGELGGARRDGQSRQLGDGARELVALRDEVGVAGELDDHADTTLDDDVDRSLVRLALSEVARLAKALDA